MPILPIRCAGADVLDLDKILEFQGDLKHLSSDGRKKLRKLIETKGFSFPFFIWRNAGKFWTLDGHQRKTVLQEMRAEGWEIPPLPVCWIEAADEREAKEKLLAATSHFAEITFEGLKNFIEPISLSIDQLKSDFSFPSLDIQKFEQLLSGTPGPSPTQDKGRLADQFLVPPFSILDARQGYWRERKEAWLSLGIRSEIGRGGNLLGMSETCIEPDPEKRAAKNRAASFRDNDDKLAELQRRDRAATPGGGSSSDKSAWQKSGGYGVAFGPEGNASAQTGTSIFDPVLCELIYRWFSGKGATVLDPFAGGSVRGIVAGHLGRHYFGGELRTEQVEENRRQATEIKPEAKPVWVAGDSRVIDQAMPGVRADLVFSCPPYADLEVYSEDPADLSNMPYDEFRTAYWEIIERSCAMLKEDRFACFVVGEVRDKKTGGYRNFVADTIEGFRRAGLSYYNEAILVTSVGSLAIRAGRVFAASRKIGKTHQNVLIFCKGNWKKAVAACGVVELSDAMFEPQQETTG